ncbi:DUF1465 family protein [Altererythrobacter sp. GH1-8]|uniref:DUF1465 family protein n=1 Tax=Altererythrobacter sp. GH1-8 TaxID=3349333 RepID=UPI00374DB86B
MSRTTSLSQPIIESLYTEALVLADEVRAVFAQGLGEERRAQDDLARLTFSSEGLKATTRMMHILAWLLNQRAYFSGELNSAQLRQHGALPEDQGSTEAEVERLDPISRELVDETIRLHRRIFRLDSAWRSDFDAHPGVHAMHERLGRAIMQSESRSA